MDEVSRLSHPPYRNNARLTRLYGKDQKNFNFVLLSDCDVFSPQKKIKISFKLFQPHLREVKGQGRQQTQELSGIQCLQDSSAGCLPKQRLEHSLSH